MARERSNWRGSPDSEDDRIRASDKDRRGRVVDLKGISNGRLGSDRYKDSSKNRHHRDDKERDRNEGSSRSVRKESQLDGFRESKRDKEISDKQTDSRRKEHSNEEKRNRYQKETYNKSEKNRDEKYRHREEREKYPLISNKHSHKDERESKHHVKDERETTNKYRDEENNYNRGKKRMYDEKEGLNDLKGKNVKETMKRENEDSFDLKGKSVKEKSPSKFSPAQNRNNNSRQEEEEQSPVKDNNNSNNWNHSKNWNNNSKQEDEDHTQTNRNNWNNNSRQEEEEHIQTNRNNWNNNFKNRNNNSKNWNNNSRQDEEEHAQTNRNNWNNNSKNWSNNSRQEEEEHPQKNHNNWNNNFKNRNNNSQAFGSFDRDRNPNSQSRNFNQKSNFIRPKRAGSTNTFFGNRDHRSNFNNDNNNNNNVNNNYNNNCNDSNNIMFGNNLLNGASNIPYWPWPQRGPMPAGFHPLATQFPFNIRPQTLDLAQLATFSQNPLAQTLDLAHLASLSQAQLTQTLDLTQLTSLAHGQIPIHPTLDLTQLTHLNQDLLPQTLTSTQLAPSIVHSQTLESNQFNPNHEEINNQFPPNPNSNPNQLALQNILDEKDFPNSENPPEKNESDKLSPPVNNLKDQNDNEKIKEERIVKKAKRDNKSPFCYDYYLSKIGGISENLTEKGLYEKCMKLLQKDSISTSMTDGNSQNIKKASNSNSNCILRCHFPAMDNQSLFQKSLSHYKSKALNSLNPDRIKEEVLLEEASSNPSNNNMETDEEEKFKSCIEIRVDEDQNVTTSISCKNAMDVDLVPCVEEEGFKSIEGKNVVFGAQSCEGVLLPDNCKVGLSQIPC